MPKLMLSLLFMLFASLTVAAPTAHSVDALLQHPEAPSGVIFEIVTGQEHGLTWALPIVKRDIARLQQRFPGLPVAVVSHGREQFALQSDPQSSNAQAKAEVQSLVKSGVPVHVCGTYAARRGLSVEDFAEFVNVSDSGPAQINDYLALGFVLIKISRPPAVKSNPAPQKTRE